MREDWIECKSIDLLDVRDGTHDTPKYINDGGFPLITSKNLIKGNIDFSNTKFISEIDMNLINQRSKVDIGDILFAMIGTIGNPVVVKEEPRFSIKNIGLFKNRIKAVDSLLFKYFLDSPLFLNQLDKRQLLKGTTQKFIPLGSLRDIDFPFAPLPEQRAIVKKLESLFSSLDAGVADLKKAQQQLKIYRQAVLKKAFEGELTSKFVMDGLPNRWKIVKIVDLVDKDKNALKAGPFGSSLKKEFYTNDGYKIYGQEQVIKSNPYFGDYYVDEQKYNELYSCRVRPNDILISLVGTVGKVLLLPYDCLPGIINPRLVKITLDLKKYLPLFFKYYFESAFVKSFYSGETRGTTMDVLNLGIIKTIPFPLPHLDEQKEIVKQIESRLSVCDSIEQNIKESLEKSEALCQSILKKAFEGKLLTSQESAECKQATDYEPASVLLERIKAENKKK